MKINLAICLNRRNVSAGFTLLELITAVAIMAILFGIAIPSFQNTIRTNQIAAQTNALVTTIALARSEAVKRAARITICSRNGAACAGSTDWSTGWVTFVDTDGNGDLDVGELTLLVSPTSPAGIVVASTQKIITFQSNGENFTQTTLGITKSGCGAGEKRQLTIELTGRTSLTKKDCP